MQNANVEVGKIPSARPFEEMRETGLLWAINRVLLHPRGYALGFVYNDEDDLIGWKLIGDGREPWSYVSDAGEDDLFRRFEAFLGSAPERLDVE